MTNSESAAAVEYSIRARFDEVCQRLEESQLHDRMDKAIGYWALSGDRRLPYALLERKVRDLISTPLRELARTPAIGKKKLNSLVTLLERVLADQPSIGEVTEFPAESFSDDRMLPDAVSEAHWEAWRETVRAFQLGGESLGRYVASLRALPTVIWDAPLSTYLDMPLSQVRRLKTHGDKRVRNVLEVFFNIHQVLKGAKVARHFVVAVRPSFVVPVEQWVLDVLRRDDPPTLQDLRQNFVLPVLNQIESDGDETIGRLVAGRIGVESAPESAIEQAERLNVTRARVYQLLEQAARIMQVRWPEGRWQIAALIDRIRPEMEKDERLQMLDSLQSLLYPEKLRPAPVQLETAAPAAAPA